MKENIEKLLTFVCEKCDEIFGYAHEYDDCVFSDEACESEMNVATPSFISPEKPYYAKAQGRCFCSRCFCSDCWEKM